MPKKITDLKVEGNLNFINVSFALVPIANTFSASLIEQVNLHFTFINFLSLVDAFEDL